MKAFVLVLLAVATFLSVGYRFCRMPRPHRFRPTPTHLSWKQIAAGGAAGAGLVAAYKVSDGVEDGIREVAKEAPEAFPSVLGIVMLPLILALLLIITYVIYRVWRWRKKENLIHKD